MTEQDPTVVEKDSVAIDAMPIQRVALVTGASRGIGRATALRLAQDGFAVMINYSKDPKPAYELAKAITEAGGRAQTFRADVSNPGDVKSMVDVTLKDFGRIDVLVNNAGITRDTLLLRLSEPDWDAVLDTNLKGAYLCTRAVLKSMWVRRSGKIINVASVAGIVGNPGQTNYSAAKAGLIGFTKATAREVAARNINVNAVVPGFIETELTDKLPDDVKAKILERIPLQRFGLVNDVAEMIAFLASDQALYITAQLFVVDGGLT